MLSFAQMERHYKLLEIIEQYRQLLSRYDADLKAARLDGLPRSGNDHIDRMGELLIRKEKVAAKLPCLLALADAEEPEVEATIKAAAGRGRRAIKTELILRARYQSGRDWPEIAALLGETKTNRLQEAVIRRLEQCEEEYHVIHPGSTQHQV